MNPDAVTRNPLKSGFFISPKPAYYPFPKYLISTELKPAKEITSQQALAKDYYEAGIKGHMTQRDFWTPVSGGSSPIAKAEQDAYVQQPGIVFNPSSALKQINEQLGSQLNDLARSICQFPQEWLSSTESA